MAGMAFGGPHHPPNSLATNGGPVIAVQTVILGLYHLSNICMVDGFQEMCSKSTSTLITRRDIAAFSRQQLYSSTIIMIVLSLNAILKQS